ncbi:conjugal transfer relaxase TraA [Moraxella lacunata]|uniref:Conjugal transfer relaxase TraA n=1 Tax=Moraxella lacunata TaxID=477 RepID=A0A378QF35_MORLA|nr:AAA family ATPase [Moraxella lacunata]STY99368.1 conjugal transfer relaxase TraA [Moraxella lacunata]
MKQSTALDILKTGQNVFLTGQAGAGKTYVLNQYIHYLRVRGISAAITASTGIAATHMNGMTIHAWSGMGIKDSFTDEDFKRLRYRQAVTDRLRDAKVLIIDEISMLHAKQVDLLDEILRTIRDNDAPFGGVQVIFSGDFFQLPPVGNKGESNKEKFAFMAKAWKTANFQICYLSEQHRQAGHDERERFGMSLNDILNQIRHQDVDALAQDILLSTRHNDISDNCTRLYTHNGNVDSINQEQLALLDGDAHTFDCTTYGDKALIEMLAKNVKAAPSLTLKIGARVMFVKNNQNLSVSNGTMGEVVDFIALPQANIDGSDEPTSTIKYPIIRLNNGRMVYAEPDEWTIEDNQGEILASYSQIPLALAWAITIHKSQGMTLDAAEIDLSRTFEMGQGYVALSRLRSLDGLKLLGMNKNSLLLDEWVFHVNNRLLEIADEQAEKFYALDDDTLSEIHKQFIIACDGITDDTIIARQEKLLQKVKDEQARKQHINANQTQGKSPTQVGKTLDETLALIKEGLSLDEIAQKRELAKSTIISHITQLIERDGKDNYLRFAPSDDELHAIKAIYDKLDAQGELEGGVKLKPIVEMSGKGNGYYNIARLALAFLDISKTDKADTTDTSDDSKTTNSSTNKDKP